MITNIAIRNVKKYYDGNLSLFADMDINNPRTLIYGKNGSGKSTLLRLIAGIEQPCEGTISLNLRKASINISSDSIDIPFLFTGHEIISLYKANKHLNLDAFNHHAKQLSLTPYLSKRYGEMSTGNRKKLSVLLAMLSQNDAVLLDEPFNGLDKFSKEFTENLISQSSMFVILVDHQNQTPFHKLFKRVELRGA
ncbi:hypothetical protein GCM10011369_11530 [Neiella marina]|uniref:AAA+ ATPase domain-containing protein n=1 Tax=Neiella marina TaxID=508461 RepID=A0A8J2U3K3_9GAMM|nr:ATP-binding cassette domain-containing protein [Neiella marina]GGA71444.1 hypothetical protein GCM10011369_11530 [Neiella marina]